MWRPNFKLELTQTQTIPQEIKIFSLNSQILKWFVNFFSSARIPSRCLLLSPSESDGMAPPTLTNVDGLSAQKDPILNHIKQFATKYDNGRMDVPIGRGKGTHINQREIPTLEKHSSLKR
jgi:hypothetical protein